MNRQEQILALFSQSEHVSFEEILQKVYPDEGNISKQKARLTIQAMISRGVILPISAGVKVYRLGKNPSPQTYFNGTVFEKKRHE